MASERGLEVRKGSRELVIYAGTGGEEGRGRGAETRTGGHQSHPNPRSNPKLKTLTSRRRHWKPRTILFLLGAHRDLSSLRPSEALIEAEIDQKSTSTENEIFHKGTPSPATVLFLAIFGLFQKLSSIPATNVNNLINTRNR